MTYTPRLECPSRNSKYYNSNENPLVACGYGMFQNNGNCTAYAWGRFFEILGTRPKLHTGNAGTWYGHTQDGYERGSRPQLGAVACWAKPGEAGHVAIVEKINSDGSVLFSNSGWRYKLFYQTTGSPSNYMKSSAYIFQGFIYNPAVKGMTDKLSEFLKVAESHVGENGDWTYKISGLSKGQPWCAAFINACAKTVGGLVNVIIPQTYGAGDVPRIGVHNKWGLWIEGPHKGNIVTPQPGDMILFRWESYSGVDTYFSDHIGVVKEVYNNIVYTIEGNSGNRVRKREYSIGNRCINGYYRPNWNLVGSNCINLVNYQPLYDTTNTREDAILREVGYINSMNKPSINLSNIRLSVINYTSSLSAIFNTGSNSCNQTVITDGLASGPRTVVEYLTSKGLNAAAGIGVAANIKHESNFRTSAVGDNGTSFGICQWHLGRGEAMKKMAGPNWQTNLTGQLDYLYYELCNSYSYVLSALKCVPNNESGARQAADVFVRKFEIPSNLDKNSQIRQNSASEYWKQIIPQLI